MQTFSFSSKQEIWKGELFYLLDELWYFVIGITWSFREWWSPEFWHPGKQQYCGIVLYTKIVWICVSYTVDKVVLNFHGKRFFCLTAPRVRFQSFSDSASLVREPLKSYPWVSEISRSWPVTDVRFYYCRYWYIFW